MLNQSRIFLYEWMKRIAMEHRRDAATRKSFNMDAWFIDWSYLLACLLVVEKDATHHVAEKV